MKLSNLTFIVVALYATIVNWSVQSADNQSPLEEIYIARSVREARISPTEFCAKARTGIDNPTTENQFTLRSVATRTSDGRVLDTNVKTIGSIHTCGGPTANPAIFQFFGDFFLERVAFKAVGECHTPKPDFPERGLSFTSCVFDLSGLPGEYIGGQLTSSTMNSLKILGTETEPPGYTQASIATIRLWKKRDER
jgi:hypothetical protein